MNKKLKKYIKNIDVELNREKIQNVEEVIDIHFKQIQFFQHERLVHFLVTMLVTLLAFFSFLFCLITFHPGVLVLFFIFILLDIPYLLYYYQLENGIQKLYEQYFLLVEKRR